MTFSTKTENRNLFKFQVGNEIIFHQHNSYPYRAHEGLVIVTQKDSSYTIFDYDDDTFCGWGSKKWKAMMRLYTRSYSVIPVVQQLGGRRTPSPLK